MLARKALAGTAGAPKVYVEEVFSTYLTVGNGTTTTITNDIDLSGKGGLVWLKDRTGAGYHSLGDTERSGKRLFSNTTDAETSNYPFSFTSSGFTANGNLLDSGRNFVSWTFRKAKKFFDVVTYTGTAGGTKTISHNLGSVPGMLIVKSTTRSGDRWFCWHRSIPTQRLILNTDGAQDSGVSIFGNGTNVIEPTSTQFTVGNNSEVNDTGQTYVAYLFAHDAGGFGDAGSDSIIKCGSVVGASQVEVDLGWEPQWLLVKNTSASQDWWVVDNMRGLPVQDTSSAYNASALRPNLSDAETTGFSIAPSSTGFKANVLTSSQTYIYIAIRRGPMKTPTSGTSVFQPTVRTGTGTSNQSISGLAFPPDLVITRNRPSNLNDKSVVFDKLRGATKYLITSGTDAEATGATSLTSFNQTGETFGDSGLVNGNGDSYINWQFRRAPGFFDVVCYTGTGSATTVTHNLGVAPELMIVKRRGTANAWAVYANNDNTDYLVLNTTAATVDDATYWNDTSPTSSVFSVGTNNATNASGSTYVAYLFASLTGISKVGSYTGNGSNQTINCGFTAGARFIIIKRTDSTGDWYVYDSARGIISGNDPQLKLNSTAAEATGYDAVDPDNSGFIVNNDATNFPINVNSATYIFLAIS